MKTKYIEVTFPDIIGDKDWEERAIKYAKQVAENVIREEIEKERKSAPIWDEIEVNKGVYIGVESKIYEIVSLGRSDASKNNKNISLTKKHARASLAMSQISQLMPYYGGEITNEEWCDASITKYTVVRGKSNLQSCKAYSGYEFIAFRTEEYRDKFMSREENVRLIKDYYMMD